MGASGSETHQAFTISPAATTTAEGVAEIHDAAADRTAGADAGPTGEPTDPTTPTPPEPANGEWDSTRLLTPLPATLPVGDGVGTAVAVGGADLVDGSATLTAYQHPDGHGVHEVLRCTLTGDAEDKLLDAVASTNALLIPIQVDTVLSGRVPLDETNQLHEQLAKVAKSINHHHADGTPIPEHTAAGLAKVQASLDELGPAAPGSAEAAMLAHYQAAASACAERLQPGFATPYTAGGKIAMIDPYLHSGPATITQMVPDPTWAGGDGLVATTRPLSRIAAHLANGAATWDGASRVAGKGSELVIDLDDGYQAVYRPAAMNPTGSSDLSLRGNLELIAPPGAGHHHQLITRLGRLNVVNRPMNATEAEWAYLQRNVYAHELEQHPAVTAAVAAGAGLDDAHEQTLFAQRAHEVIGLDDAGISSFARQLRLDAEADALGDKVALLRHGVATALGHPDGAALAASPDYQPTPHRRGGWLTWDRIGHSTDQLTATFAGRSLVHRVTGNNLSAMLASGVFVSTERRRQMGITTTVGMSETADQRSGGARSVFVRIQHTPALGSGGGARLIWDDPGRLLSRTDWYAYNGDHFGATDAGTSHSVKGQTRNPTKVAAFGAGNNEVMIAHGLDLLGADAPTRIICGNATERTHLINQLAAAGVTSLGGRPLTKVITA